MKHPIKSRDRMLERLRAQALPEVALPALEGVFPHHGNVVQAFGEAVELAAGKLVVASERGGVAACAEELCRTLLAERLCSLTPEVSNTVALTRKAHSYESVDLLVARAQFGVAENGAVWVDDAACPQRSLFFLAEHVMLLLSASELVHTMHEAYARITLGARPFGCFISGPSKTADIEQALVVGAHGPRSLTIVLD